MSSAIPRSVEQIDTVRGAAGQMAGGVAIVITLYDGTPHAATASSGVVASFDPPLLAVLFARGSRMADRLTHGGRFTFNLLHQADHALARRFANPNRASGWSAFAGIELQHRGPAPPILAHAAAWFDCHLQQAIEIGDHTCFIGEVTACDRDPVALPLVYHRGRLHTLGPPAAPPSWSTVAQSDLASDW